MANPKLPVSPLSANERLVMDFIEQDYLLNGAVPSIERIGAHTFVPTLEIAAMMKNPAVTQGLDERSVIQRDEFTPKVLSPKQLLIANAMLDFTDGRSDKKKLQDYGVSSSQYQAWLKDPVFKQYIRERAENLLGDSLHEAHSALLSAVRSGDVNAIKLHYEITGRWSSKTVSDLNV